MKKGVVLKIIGEQALVLERGGKFARIRAKRTWAVGDVVSLGAEKSGRGVRFWAAHAAGILVLLFTIQFGIYHYAGQPATYISLDVNPSVELVVNRLGRVVEATAYNPDGQDVLEGLALNGKPYSAAVQALLESEAMQAHLADDPAVMLAVTSQEENALEILIAVNGLGKQLNAELGEAGQDIHVLCQNVDWDVMEHAHELGVTPGRLALFEQLEGQGEDAGMSLEAFLDSPVEQALGMLGR